MNRFKVSGMYYVSGKFGGLDSYEAEFDLEEDREAHGRMIIRNSLIEPWLQKNINNYKGIQTCQVVSIKKITGSAANPELEKLLVKAGELGCMPVNYSQLKNDELRQSKLKESIAKKEAKILKFNKKEASSKYGKLDEGFV